MSEHIIEISIIILLLIINGIFAMSEIAVVSSKKFRLSQWAKNGNKKAQLALNLANEPDKFLSTVQIGITLIGIFAGAFGGAKLTESLADFLNGFQMISEYSEGIALAVVVLFITYLSLIIGELVPKRLGLQNPEIIASNIAGPMIFLSKIANPIVFVLANSTGIFLKIFRIKKSDQVVITEQEIKELMRQGTQAGIFEKSEQELVQNIFNLDDLKVAAIMVPRIKIVWLDLEDSVEQNLNLIRDHQFARYLVGEKSLDNLVGFIRVKDVFLQTINREEINFRKILRKPIFITESSSPLKVFEEIKSSGVHIAVVIDEHGAVQGMLTSNDIIESVVGDMTLSGEKSEEYAIQREDGSWLFDGRIPIVEIKEILSIQNFPEEENYNTLAGFILNTLGTIPKASEHFIWNNFRFEVVDMDGKRIDKILVQPVMNS